MLTVGVPEMVPFPELNERPLGRLGLMAQEVVAPPDTDGVQSLISS
jgi:hypothetical protein